MITTPIWKIGKLSPKRAKDLPKGRVDKINKVYKIWS